MADIITSIYATGTETELAALLHVLQKYSRDRKNRYIAQNDCWYLQTNVFDDLSQENVSKLIADGTISCRIPGPYGVVCDPNSDYNCLFTDLADAAPMARFDIGIEGFDVGGNISSTALLREGKLYFNTDYRDFGCTDEVQTSDGHQGGGILAGEGAEKALTGLTFVITGDLKKFKNRDAMTIFIEERDGSVGSSVTKKTSFLINNAKKSKTAKNTKAKELGVPILTEKEFLEKFELDYQPRKSTKGKMYEVGYYDPIRRTFQPARKLKKEPLTLQITFECANNMHPTLQINLDVEECMRLACTPDAILGCDTLDELERLLMDSVKDEYGYASEGNQQVVRHVAEYQALLAEKWLPVKKAVGSLENIDRMILRRTDVRKEVRFISWARAFHIELMDLAKKAAICKSSQKAENIAAFEAYLDAQTIWFPWSESPGWPTGFCGYKEKADLDWRSLADDAELFAKMIVAEDIADLDHGEETTIIDFRTREYTQTASYYPGW